MHKAVASQAARAGIMAASANIAATFARGMLPRSVKDQAIITGVCTAAMYEAATTAHAAAQTLALLTTGSHGMRGRKPDPIRTMAVDLTFVALGATVDQLLPPKPNEMLATSITRFAADTLMLGGAAGCVIAVTDEGLRRVFPRSGKMTNRPIIADVLMGGVVAAITLAVRNQHAKEYGLVEPERVAIKRANLKATLEATGIGLASAAGMLVLATGEQLIAHGVQRLLNEKVQRFDIGSPLLGHAVALGVISSGVLGAYFYVGRRIQINGDIIEPAYQEPPTNPNVSAGPKSLMDFDDIGMEGRRFVLMALTAQEISAVMGEPATDPIRIVAGFESKKDTKKRAELCLKEMEAVGAFDKSMICIASPTGVGYVSYMFAETMEYLTRGDIALVMPQYALVPSFMALFDTHDGRYLQRLVLRMTRDRIASMPPEKRPRLVQFGESLGAQVALDVAYPNGAEEFDALGIEAGLYLGVPFRSHTWNAWRNAPQEFDPARTMWSVPDSNMLTRVNERRSTKPKHVMIVHDDDPVNKISYRLVVKQPWWMGPPSTRPPKIPRETVWRPVTTFVITVIDLMNGMNFKPGELVRMGHDYRMDTRDSCEFVFDLHASPQQQAAIDAALVARETEWATRRLIARKFGGARDAVQRTLKSWGVPVPQLPDVADIDPTSTSNPEEGGTVFTRFGSSGIG